MVTNDMGKLFASLDTSGDAPGVPAICKNPNGLEARLYFLETGPNSTIAFFDWERAEDFNNPAGL